MKWFKNNKNTNDVYATNDGKIKSLSLLKDGVFSKKMLGDGIAIFPNRNDKVIDILSPISGKLVSAFSTKHAFGIKTNKDIEVLVHIGIDTVNLEGKGFDMHVSQNQKVKNGDKLVTVDLEYLRKHIKIIDIIIVVTSKQHKIDKVALGEIKKGERLFKIIYTS